MDLSFIEHHPQRVLAGFRQGEFDAIEILGQADERDFFERCFKEQLLVKLAEGMPTARKKQEVPRWFILAANLSLKLHQENSFLGLERVVRCGGLLAALPPDLAAKHLDPASQRWVLKCKGFNDKNSYDRQTPCHHDTLRKALKDVRAARWLQWFNTAVQSLFQQYGFFDPAGIFVGDASYLFVPDNPAYEDSVVMWFDEHNHPVDYDKLSPAERKKAHRERCYKWISLLHLRGGCFVYAAATVLPGNAHEVGPFYDELVAQFVATAGKGVIKWLILDRGFIDGQRISRCKHEWGLDVLIPMKKNLDIWADAWGLAAQAPWQEAPQETPPPAPVPVQRPEHIRRQEAKRQATLARLRAAAPPPPPEEIWSHQEFCALKDFTSWTAATVPLHVVCVREHYVDGHHDQWALMTTHPAAPPLQLLGLYSQRSAIEERHRQLKCFYDLSHFRSRRFNAIAAQVVMILLTYTLRQWQLWKWFDETLANLTPVQLLEKLNLCQQWVVIYLGSAYMNMPLLTFTREVLQLEAPAREKVLKKIRALEQTLFEPLPNPRPS